MPKNQLTDMKFDEVSLVDRGANQYAKTVISKRDITNTEENVEPEIYDEDGVLVNPDDLQVGDVIVDEEGNEFEVTEDALQPVAKSTAGKVLDYAAYPGVGSAVDAKDGKKGKAFANTFGRAVAGTAAGFGAGAGIGAGIGALTKKPGAARVGANVGGSVGNLAGALAGTALGRKANKDQGNFKDDDKQADVKKSYADEIREELSKAMSDEARDEILSKALGSIEEYAEIAKAAEQAAQEERELRVTNEYIEVAKSYSLGIDPEVLGPVLKRCAEALSHEDQEVLAHALSVGTEAIEKAFYEEQGVYGLGSNSDVLNSVDEHLATNIGKSDLSRDEQIAKMFEDNPNLYNEYEAEHRSRLGYGY